MGKSMFIDLRDQSGRIQIYAQKNALEEKMSGSWDIFTHLDLGDFIGATGTLFRHEDKRAERQNRIVHRFSPKPCDRRRRNGTASKTPKSAIASVISI